MNLRQVTFTLAALSAIGACLGQDKEAVFGPMRKEAYLILRSAVAAATRRGSELQEKNLDALDRFAKAPWPRLSGLRCVRVHLEDEGKSRELIAWQVKEGDKRVSFIGVDLRRAEVAKGRIEKIEPGDLRDVVGGLIGQTDSGDDEGGSRWGQGLGQGFERTGYPFHPGSHLFRLAYAAADHGLGREANRLVREVFRHAPQGLPDLHDELAWQALWSAVSAFRDGGSRSEFLGTCQQLLVAYPGSRYDRPLESLVGPLEREASRPRPAFLSSPPKERSEEDTIRYWVYQLRQLAIRQFSTLLPPQLFACGASWGGSPTPADHLVRIGPPAIPFLVEAMADETPTRTLVLPALFQPQPVPFLLRRQDVAVKCLERIVGCRFHVHRYSSTYLSMDTPGRRASAIANIRDWWGLSKGAPQTEMIRNQLRLRGYDRIRGLEAIAMLEGPEAVIAEARAMLDEDRYGRNSPVVEVLNHMDPQSPVRAAFQRFRERQSREGDDMFILKYGDRAIYEEVARRYEPTGKPGPGGWRMGGRPHMVARYGKNWAIPILAKMLEQTKMSGSRSITKGVAWQPYSTADEAAERFQRLTGRDFGYRREDGTEQRLAAIRKARIWWEAEGREAMKERIAEDHPPEADPGDLFLSEEQIEAKAEVIASDDELRRRKTIGSLGETFSYKIQRALLHALRKENEPSERMKILGVLEKHPALWHLPSLTEVLENDVHLAVREFAARIIRAVVDDKSTSIWWTRLETRELALTAARALAQSPAQPKDLRHACADILLAWDSPFDRELFFELAKSPDFRDHENLQGQVQKMARLGLLKAEASKD